MQDFQRDISYFNLMTEKRKTRPQLKKANHDKKTAKQKKTKLISILHQE
jgi:hypothetical protein